MRKIRRRGHAQKQATQQGAPVFNQAHLQWAMEAGIIDGYVIIDEERTGSIIQGERRLTREEIAETIRATYGVDPVMVVLRDTVANE